MKRGVRGTNFDMNKSLQSYKKKDDQVLVDRKRRPSKIEERLRMRKLHLDNIQRIKSPRSVIKSANTNADDNSNSCDSSIANTNSCSSTSSENCNPSKIRNSKQRVDLFELQASNRLPINYILSKKPEGRSKINGEKIGSLFIGRSKILKARAKSAPCTPLFQIKYAKDNLNRINFGGGKNFSDFQNAEKDRVGSTAATDQETLIINDEIINEQPIGNPALISVMTESLDKMKEISKSRKSGQEIDNGECDEGIHRQKSSCSNLNLNLNFATSIIEEIEQNSAPQETEISSKLSASTEVRSNECSTENCEESHANLKNKESNLEPRNDNASEKSLEKCCNCKMEKNRVNISPRNLTEKEIAGRYNILHQPTLDVNFIEDQRTESSCRSRNLQLQLNRTGDCRPHGCNNICKNEINDFGRIQISNADLNGCRNSTCCGNPIRNYSRPSSALKESKPGTNRYSDQKRVCLCRIDAAKFNCRSNFESDSVIRCGEDHSAVSIAEYDIPSLKIVPSPKMVTKCSSNSKAEPPCREATRSCDYCNRTAAKCYPKVFAPRSKSTPRRVTFCLPSLIPEEEDNSSRAGEDKTVDDRSQICKRGGTGYSGVRKSDQNSRELKRNEFSRTVLQGSKKSGRISRCNFHSHCGCNFHHKPRSPRVNFCREVINKRQDVVRGDLDDLEERSKVKPPKDSESKTSVTSAKEWAVDSVEENLNYFNDVPFPKETRQAMSVLLQSRAGNPTAQLIHGGEISHVAIPGPQPHRKQLSLREVKLSKKPDLGIFDSERHKAMHVAKYAQALAVFQRTCDPLQELGDRTSCKKKQHNTVRKGISDGGN